MSNATRTIVETTREVAALIDAGVGAGLPAPQSVGVASYSVPHLMFRTFRDVERWADHFDVPWRTSWNEDNTREFIRADYGGVRLTTNRPTDHDPLED